jgi:hypothetical protein
MKKKMFQPTPEKGIVTLLCGVPNCCPTVDFTNPDSIILNDFGGQVKLTKSQWNDLKARFAGKK